MMPGESLKVEVLTVPGCSSARPVVEAISKVASELMAPIEITETIIDSQEDAEKRRFPGSPTVLVEGVDIDSPLPGSDTRRYGLT